MLSDLAGNLDQYTDGDLEEFFNCLKAGDENARRLWDAYLDDLAMAIHNIKMLFDGDIILGGYVGAYIKDYMKDLCQRVDARDPFEDRSEEFLIECQYKVEAAAAGAALYFIDEFFDHI